MRKINNFDEDYTEIKEKIAFNEEKMIKMEFKDFVKEVSEKELTFAGLNYLIYGGTPAGVPKKSPSDGSVETDILKAKIMISSTSVTAEMISGNWIRINLSKKNIVNVFKWAELADTYIISTVNKDNLILTTAKDRKGI